MGLWGADDFLRLLVDHRVVHIGGRYSGGKTSLAFWLAHVFIEQGLFKRVVCNIRSEWSDDPDSINVGDGVLDTVIIIDEAGQKFYSSRDFLNICDYAAKMNVIYLLSSYSPPPPRVAPVLIQPVFRMHKIGLPMVLYKWWAHLLGVKDSGWFLWWFPDVVNGLYDRQDTGDGLEAIARLTSRAARALSGRSTSGGLCRISVDSSTQQVSPMDEATRAITQAADVLADSASEFSRVVEWSALPKGRKHGPF